MTKFKIKLVTLVVMILCTLFALTGCSNYDHFDTVRTYDYAIIRFPNDTVKELKLKSWRDYEGEQLQLIDTNGNIYLVSSFNCVLVKEG